jgi:hypothetical protein
VIGHKKFVFEANSRVDLLIWLSLLQQHHTQSLGYKNDLGNEILLPKKFWKINMITLTEFKQTVDTGDILLFKSKNVGSKL